MKNIEVVAALILDDRKLLATQRGYGEFEGGWEFPGGKIEPNETPEQALAREIHEELNADIKVGPLLLTIEHDYETFHLTMHNYLCNLKSDSIELLEHKAAKWLDDAELDSLDWLPADIQIIDHIKSCGGLESLDEQIEHLH